MFVAWLQTRFSTGAASSGSSPWKGSEMEDDAAAIAFAVLSTGGSSWAIAVTFEGPERRPPVADQFGSDRLHDLGRIVEPVVTVGSSMLIALQAGVG